MQGNTIKRFVAVMAWIISTPVSIATCYSGYLFYSLMKDMPYGLYATIISFVVIAAGLAQIIVYSSYYFDVYRIYSAKKINA
jgi:hypothetical protein